MVDMKSSILQDVMLCSIMRVKYSSACCLLNAGFLLGLFFEPKHEGDMFLHMLFELQWTTLYYIPDDSSLNVKECW
jgi:hypothetical protein